MAYLCPQNFIHINMGGNSKKMYKVFFSFLLLAACGTAYAQRGGDLLNKFSGRGNSSQGSNKDTIAFEHRDDAKDSINISYKYLDSIRMIRMDSSVNDFYTYFSLPAAQQYLGVNGAAGYSLLFSPYAKAGWDAGFHAYDAYLLTLENTRFFKTSKPFTQLAYQLATGKEQMIKILHTQNPMPNLNFGFEFRLVNAPGFFVTQNTNNSNLRLFSNYLAKRKRYAAYFVLMSNNIKAAENGGIQNDSFLTNKDYAKRFTVPVNLGGASASLPNPFNTKVNTGNLYKETTFFLRQYYDIGKKDSVIVNDSTTDYLFYSKLRFQHTFTYSKFNYLFTDDAPDSARYKKWYDTTLKNVSQIAFNDGWKIIKNDFSLLQFPDTKNSGQFFLAGAWLENIAGNFEGLSRNFYNIALHAEYRNKTKNKLWDILAKGELYMNGLNAGDYNAYASLSRYLNKKWGYVTLLFNNVNRSPSFIYDSRSSFNYKNAGGYNKENIIIMKATADNPFISLAAANYFITNYLYFSNYYKTAQYSKVINLLQLSASKKIKISKRWNWYAEATLQQTDAAAPVKVPLLYTRNRFAYEGVFYKNLNLSTGIEFRYYTPYKAYDYSPVMGKFVPQDSVTIRNRPDISAFMHFRIKSFTLYIRIENLNSIAFTNGFGFTHNNFAAPHYVYPGLVTRFGIQWNFVN